MPRKTLRDIARETGFAISTISSIINNRKSCYASESTRQKIMEAVKRLNYQPDHFARSLRMQQSHTIGVGVHIGASNIQAVMLRKIRLEIESKGYFVTFADTSADLGKTLLNFANSRTDGVIIISDKDEPNPCEGLIMDLPVVLIAPRAGANVPTLVVDRTEAVRRAASYLIQIGHKNISFVLRKPKFNRTKLAGYEKAMKEAGLEKHARIINVSEILGSTWEFVRKEEQAFRESTAILTTGDQVALELLSGLRFMGIAVPDELSVVGFNDERIAASVIPTLTSIRLPTDEIATTAVEMLLNLVGGKNVRNRKIIPDLILRESTAPPRASAK